jgi:hypothetical protein
MPLELIQNEDEFFPLWIFYAVLGGTGIITGLSPVILKEYLWINEVVLSMGVGIIFGATGVVAPLRWPMFFPILEEITRIVLAIQVTFFKIAY